MFIPRLSEEEARYLTLRYLAQAPKRQGGIEDIRAFVKASRDFGEEDMRPNPNRSNAPYWHQIVQNATDRIIKGHGFVNEVAPSPHKIIRLTDKALDYIRPFAAVFERNPEIETFTFFDNAILDNLYAANREKLQKAFRRVDTFVDFIKSRRVAEAFHSTLEANGKGAAFFLDGLEQKFQAATKTEEQAFRLRQIKAWRQAREGFDPLPF